MRHITIKPFLFLVFALLFSCSGNAQDNLFTAVVRYSSVGIDDEFEMEYKSRTGSVKTIEPDFQDFTKIKGYYLSVSSSRSMKDGTMNCCDTVVTFTYTLKAKRTGTLKIGRAALTTREGKIIYSEPITIAVVEGSALVVKPNTPSANPFDAVWGNMSNDMALSAAQVKAHYKYIVGWGQVYQKNDSAISTDDKKNRAKVLQETINFFQRRGRCDNLGSLPLANSAVEHYFYCVDDTTGVRDGLKKIYAQDNSSKYRTTIVLAKGWDIFFKHSMYDNAYHHYEAF